MSSGDIYFEINTLINLGGVSTQQERLSGGLLTRPVDRIDLFKPNEFLIFLITLL